MKNTPFSLTGHPIRARKPRLINRDCYPMCRQPVQSSAPTTHTCQSYPARPEFSFLHLYTNGFFFFQIWLIPNRPTTKPQPILAALSGISQKMRTRKGAANERKQGRKKWEEGTKQDQAEVKPRRTLAAAWRRKKRCSPTFLKMGWRVHSEGIMQARRKLQKYQ